jgi:hypothetical protein
MATSNRQLSTTPDHTFSHNQGRSLPSTMLDSYALLWLATLLSALLAIPIARQLRGYFFDFRLIPASGGSVSIAAHIFANNVREAMIPFLFAVLRVGPRRRRMVVAVGDVVVAASLGANATLAGLALGSYGLGLASFLPQWPLEWGALALAFTAWRRARVGRQRPFELALLAFGTAILLCLAALLETYAVPQG